MSGSAVSYSIRDLSRDFGVTTRTCVSTRKRVCWNPSGKGIDASTAAQTGSGLLILRGKRLGFSLDESAELIAMYDPESNNAAQLRALIEKIKEQQGA